MKVTSLNLPDVAKSELADAAYACVILAAPESHASDFQTEFAVHALWVAVDIHTKYP